MIKKLFKPLLLSSAAGGAAEEFVVGTPEISEAGKRPPGERSGQGRVLVQFTAGRENGLGDGNHGSQTPSQTIEGS